LPISWLQCFDAVGRKGIRPVKTEWWDAGVAVWGEVQICIWPSWYRCHSLSLAPVNPDWFYFPGFTFLVPTHPGSPGQSLGGRKTVAVVVYYCQFAHNLPNANQCSVFWPRYFARYCSYILKKWWLFNDAFTTDLIVSLPVKDLWKMAKIWHSYRQKYLFFDSVCQNKAEPLEGRAFRVYT